MLTPQFHALAKYERNLAPVAYTDVAACADFDSYLAQFLLRNGSGHLLRFRGLRILKIG